MTSHGSVTDVLLFVVVIAVSLSTARRSDRPPRIPLSAVAVWLPVALISVLQGLAPSLLHGMRRDPDLINNSGQWWRVFTSVFVQDGGFVGTALNLLALAVVAIVAAEVWGGPRMFVMLCCSQLIYNLLSTYVFPEVGAGSAAATLGLASSVAGLVTVLTPSRRELVSATATLLFGALMLTLDDAHGEGVLVGLAIGAVVGVIWPPHAVAAR